MPVIVTTADVVSRMSSHQPKNAMINTTITGQCARKKVGCAVWMCVLGVTVMLPRVFVFTVYDLLAMKRAEQNIKNYLR